MEIDIKEHLSKTFHYIADKSKVFYHYVADLSKPHI